MPTRLTVQAEIINLSNDDPRQSDIFLVDTNVWLWQTYASSIPRNPIVKSKIKLYTSYLKQARVNGATLVYSGLILSELAHVIERTERAIYERKTGLKVDSKDYRHNNPTERANVVAEVDSAWRQVEKFAVSVDLSVNDTITNAALTRFNTQALDGYDLLILEAISRAGVGQVKVITDDMDYAVVPSIQLFTSNHLVLAEAKAQGKLVFR